MPTNTPRLQIAERENLPISSESREKSRVRWNLRATLGDGAAYSVMLALGETYFQAFAVALGTRETLVGLVATLPLLMASIIQLAAPAGMRRVGSHKWWIVGASALQGVAVLLLPIAIFLPQQIGFVWIMGTITLYWASVQSAGPAWNTWIEGLLPRRIRTPFLACRARVSQTFSLLGFLCGGLAVHAAASNWTDRSTVAPAIVLWTYAGMFITAALARFMSVGFLSCHQQPPGEIKETGPTMLQFFTGQASGSGSRLIFYLLAMQVAVQISGPFFYPFLLQEIKISFFTFMTLVTIAFLGKVLALPFWGYVAKAGGARHLFWVAATAIVPISGLWIFAHWFEDWKFSMTTSLGTWQLSGAIAYIAVVQFISGVTWGAYELAMSLMFLESIPRQNRTTVLTYYNFGNSTAMMIGSLIGGAILWTMSESYSGYLVLFGISSLARFLTVLAFGKAPEVPVVDESPNPRLRVITAEEVEENAAESSTAPHTAVG